MQGEIRCVSCTFLRCRLTFLCRGLRSTLEIVLEATRNPTNEAPWIRLASDAFRGQMLILAKSPSRPSLPS
jgi:hypothetical protein